MDDLTAETEEPSRRGSQRFAEQAGQFSANLCVNSASATVKVISAPVTLRIIECPHLFDRRRVSIITIAHNFALSRLPDDKD